MDSQLAKLQMAMVCYDQGDPKRIHHFLKVYSLAKLIGCQEGLPAAELFILETAAILHDIGIHPSEKKYGFSDGIYQQKEGPAEARKLMETQGGYSEEQIQRVCYLIAHHHTYTHIQGLDYQILVEADFLVNIYEDEMSEKAVEHVRQNIFKTQTGLNLLEKLYIIRYNPKS